MVKKELCFQGTLSMGGSDQPPFFLDNHYFCLIDKSNYKSILKLIAIGCAVQKEYMDKVQTGRIIPNTPTTLFAGDMYEL